MIFPITWILRKKSLKRKRYVKFQFSVQQLFLFQREDAKLRRAIVFYKHSLDGSLFMVMFLDFHRDPLYSVQL